MLPLSGREGSGRVRDDGERKGLPLTNQESPPDLPSFGQAALALADEGVALKALFEKVFFGTGLPPEAVEALSRIRFLTRPDPNPFHAEATRYILLNRGETGIGKT